MQKNAERQKGCHDAADEVDQARSDQVADAFYIRHDARNQRTSAVAIVKANWQQPNMLLHLLSQIGNHALGSFGKQLRKRKRSDRLDRCRDKDSTCERQQFLWMVWA